MQHMAVKIGQIEGPSWPEPCAGRSPLANCAHGLEWVAKHGAVPQDSEIMTIFRADGLDHCRCYRQADHIFALDICAGCICRNENGQKVEAGTGRRALHDELVRWLGTVRGARRGIRVVVKALVPLPAQLAAEVRPDARRKCCPRRQQLGDCVRAAGFAIPKSLAKGSAGLRRSGCEPAGHNRQADPARCNTRKPPETFDTELISAARTERICAHRLRASGGGSRQLRKILPKPGGQPGNFHRFTGIGHAGH